MATVLAFAVIAVAQDTASVYSIDGSVIGGKGGTKKKPVAGAITFGFKLNDPNGNQPAPIQTYKIQYEGGRINTNLLPGCTAAQMNAANGDDSGCPKGSKVGTGTLRAVGGTAGLPLPQAAAVCTGTLTLYNSRNNHLALFVRVPGSTCVADIHEAIDMPYSFDASKNLAGVQFTVPDELRHQVGLDITVTDANAKFSVIKKKKGKKKVGYIESTGCADKQRDEVVTFTDEQGQAFPYTKDLGKC